MGNTAADDARTGIQKVRDGITTAAALSATVTVVGGVLVINGQPVTADGLGADIVVTSLLDSVAADGETTLREALDEANLYRDIDTITFDAALFAGGPGQVTIDSSLSVSNGVVITGPGSELLTVTASDSSGVYVYGNSSLSLSGMTIENDAIFAPAVIVGGSGLRIAPAESGEAIISESATVVLDDVVLSSSRSSALRISRTSGAVTISNSRLDSGGSTYGTGVAVQGVYGDVDITDTEITSSAYDVAVLGIRYANAVTLTNVSITQDSAYLSGQSAGVAASYVSSLNISGSTVSGIDGTGIAVRQAGSVSIDDSTVSDNSVAAILTSTISGTSITNSTIADNGGSYSRYYSLGDGAVVSAEIANGRFGPRTADSLALVAEYATALTIANSTISGNYVGEDLALISASSQRDFFFYYDAPAQAEGAEQLIGQPTLVVLNSTITGNEVADDATLLSASSQPDFFFYYEAPAQAEGAEQLIGQPTLVVLNSTISGNGSDVDTAGSYVLRSDGPVLVDHSIVTSNSDLYFLDIRFPYFSEAEAQSAFSYAPVSITRSVVPTYLEGDGPNDSTNVFSDDALLSPLGDNGGTTQTMVPQPGSVAIDAGSAEDSFARVTALDLDQRGASRVSGAALDIGAVETRIDQVDVSVPASSVAESDGSVDATVTRTGAGEGEASVRVTTAGGSAAEGSDYTAIDEVVTFADGETGAKTVTLTLAVDDAVESDETLTVSLSESTNLTVGTASVEVTITDDSVPPTTTTAPPTTTTPTTTTPTTVTPTTVTPTTVTPTTVAPTTVTTTTVAPPTVTPGSIGAVLAGTEAVIQVFVDSVQSEDLEVTATSSDPSLLKVIDVKLSSGDGGNALVRTSYDVVVQAAAGGSGTATISVTASDGTNSSTQTIDVEVSNAVLPSTGSDSTMPIVTFAGLLVAAGAGAAGLSRRRKLT